MEQNKPKLNPVSFEEFAPTSYEAWKAEAVAVLKGADFDKRLLTKTYEGITLNPIYTPSDVADINAGETFPGYGDYLRGVNPQGYIAKPWDIAQGVLVECPEKANELILNEVKKGSTAVSAAINCGGIKVQNVDHAKMLLKDVDLSKTKLYFNCGFSGVEVLERLSSAQGFQNAQGCVGDDPIGMLAQGGASPYTIEALFDRVADAAKFAHGKAPALRTTWVNGNVYANGGANAVQEIAYSMATASCYIEEMMNRGICPHGACGSITFSFSLGSNFFMEIAKIRAARVVFAQMAAAYGANAEAQKINVHAKTSSFTKTVYDPYVNLLRATTETFSGVVGGIDALEVGTLDESYNANDEQTRRIARNLQLMMQEEFDLIRPIDPAGGSWYVEALTSQLAKAVWTKFQEIDAAGGMVNALESGKVQADIEAVLEKRFSALATRADKAVGTNMYSNFLEKKLDKTPTFGVACECDTDSFPVHVKAIAPHRWTERFEELRGTTEAYEAKTGETVKVFLANMGPIPQHKARADFACGFFEVGHFECLRNNGFATVEEAAKAALLSKAEVAVICSTDATYPEIVPELARAIKAGDAKMKIILAGAPTPEMKDAYIEAGVSEFIHVKANCYEIIKNIQKERGIC